MILRALVPLLLWIAPVAASATELPAAWEETAIRQSLEAISPDPYRMSVAQLQEYGAKLQKLVIVPQLTDSGYRTIFTHLMRLEPRSRTTGRDENQILLELQELLRVELMMRGNGGEVPQAFWRWAGEADPDLVASFALDVRTLPDRNRHLMRLIEGLPATPPSLQEAIRTIEFSRLKSAFENLRPDPATEAPLVAQLRSFVSDPQRPERAAALLVSQPEAFSRWQIQLGPEFLDVLRRDQVDDQLRENRAHLLHYRQRGDLEAWKQVAHQDFRSAYQYALMNSVSERLRDAASRGTAGELTSARARQLLTAVRLAASDLWEGQALGPLLQIAQQTGGRYATLFRAEALRGLAALATPEAQRALIERLDDPLRKIRRQVALALSEQKLGAGEAQLLEAKLSAMEARGVSLKTHLDLSGERLWRLRRGTMRLTAANSNVVPADCPQRFQRPALRLVSK